jgi:hypothetical protein
VPEVGLERAPAPEFPPIPPNLRNPAQSGTGTTRSEGQGVHIVHTLVRGHIGARNQAAAVRAGRLCLTLDFAPIGKAGLEG